MRQFLLFLLVCDVLWSQSFTIRTVAGSNAVGELTPAQSAALASTEGIAVDGSGNVYVADAPDHRVRKIEPSGKISTLAGTGLPGFRGDGGLATQARLDSPYGLAIDLAGNLFIADLGNARVRRISASGVISTVAGGGTADVSLFGAPMKATDAKLIAPRNIAVDPTGTLYISDFGGHRVYRLTTDGQLTHLVGAASAGTAEDNATGLTAPLKSPTALVVDRAGSLYIADSGNSAVRRLQRGLLSRVTSTGIFNKDLKFATVTGMAIDGNTGDLYVAEGRDTPVRRITPATEQYVFAYGARDLALDAAGALWLADGPFVRKLSQLGSEIVAGTGSFQFGGDGGPAVEARLRSPAGVASDKVGNIYVADTANNRVRRISPDGRIETVAGTGAAGFSGDGDRALGAALSAPMSVALDSAGNIYIADTGNHVIRRVTPAGMIDTWAGVGRSSGSDGDNRPGKQAHLHSPQGLTVDADGNLIVADTENHRVAKVSTAGWFTVLAGKGTAGNTGDGAQARIAALNRPTDVAFDGKGQLFIIDSGNRRIRWLNAQGIMNGFPSQGLVAPMALAWSGEAFYVADAGQHRVFLVAADGSRALVAGTGEPGFNGDDSPAAQAQLNRPMDLAVMSNGDLLIADQDNHRVRIVTRSSTQAGGVEVSSLTSIVNAASLKPAPAVPGGLMTLFGTGLGPTPGAVGQVDLLGRWGTSVEGVEVRFDGIAAPLFYVSDGQINLQVPRTVNGRARVTVTVSVKGAVRGTKTVDVDDSAPELFLSSGNQVAALNDDGSVNLPSNGTARGRIITFFATGTGLWDTDIADGAPPIAPYPRPRAPVTVWIEGEAAEILFAGAAPGLVGIMQLNVIIPTRAAPGQTPVVLQVGSGVSTVGPRITTF